MSAMKEKLKDLVDHRNAARAMGGATRIDRQHAKGKLTIRERIDLLLDPGSFEEYGALATHKGQKPGEPITPGDGLVAGIGRIEGRPIALYGEDATILGGSVGEINFRKRLRIMEVAKETRIPLLCLLDGAGARAQSLGEGAEGAPAVMQTLSLARHSATAPTMALVLGPCAGEPALVAAMASYSIMTRDTGMLAAGGPPVVKASTGHDVTKEELGGAKVHVEMTGMVDNGAKDDREAIVMARRVLSYLPTNAWDYPPSVEPKPAKAGSEDKLLNVLPENPRMPYDMHEVINSIVDDGSFFETKPDFARALITGFCRLNGHSVGVIANQPMVRAGALAAREAQKARKFIEFCGAYHVPIVSLADTPGVMTGPDAEREGSLKFGLGAAYALAFANAPVFTVIIRKAFGFGGALMAGYGAGQTAAYVWPSVDFSSLPPDSAVEAAHGKEIGAAENPDQLRRALIEKYAAHGGPYPAAGEMNIDDVIAPNETRARLIKALQFSFAQRSKRPEPNTQSGVMP